VPSVVDPLRSLVLLVDFGNTLVDETFMWRDTPPFTDWTSHWSEVMSELASDWDHGRISAEIVMTKMARRLGCSTTDINEHINLLCRQISFYPMINSAIAHRRQRGERQAIVTVNPDAFQTVVDLYSLRDRFDLIVTSANLGTVDKAAICSAACRALDVQASQTLLIDNIEANVDAWNQKGGQGYLFESDERFAADVQNGAVPGFEPEDC
jgi:FMN phosphatase YigB (HAD superfamily)